MSAEVDDIDRALIHALEVDGRAPFSKIAEVLGVSDQTIARRYRRLRAESIAKVVAQTVPWRVGQVRWYLRIKVEPSAALSVARALARRPRTYWVQMNSGGTEITCVAQSTSPEEPDNLLLHQLPKTPRVIDVTAHSVLNVFLGDESFGYAAMSDFLTADQVAALRPPLSITDEIVPLEEADQGMLAVLELDGRAGFAELAKATGWSESRVRRRLEALRECGAMYFDVDINSAAVGLTSETQMWMSVAPSEIQRTGEILASHPEIVFVAAMTGTANIGATACCRDVPAFYRYLTTKIASLPAIKHIETAPVIRTVKRGATLVSG
ncbi:AsnC family transcriptional regulator [Kibdelosporangium philippinense]|uniref:AsnC family transcriptional regulator n=1 Tax=Kibdelosporangium philippinense TaxID=211113 RepID=A0ABS8ZD86_9PSEU|nr:AsnC family transcriptional regulator [Kibdelosporangium philippinense]MCE7005811.1 AsnC family transcriptional regulator [Kibdelosporangium philippinense]